jgi:hypothetical protein
MCKSVDVELLNYLQFRYITAESVNEFCELTRLLAWHVTVLCFNYKKCMNYINKPFCKYKTTDFLIYIVNSTIENRFCCHFIASFTFWMRFSQHTTALDTQTITIILALHYTSTSYECINTCLKTIVFPNRITGIWITLFKQTQK